MRKILTGLSLYLGLVLSAPCMPKDSGETIAHGVHGMALLKTSSGYIASHMPLHHSMHAHQVVMRVEVEKPHQATLDLLFAKNQLISIVPEPFDLHKLIGGKLESFVADIVLGHFERGGEVQQIKARFSVANLLLSQPVGDYKNGYFYQINLTPNQILLVHRIGQLPSFDQILLLESNTESIELGLKDENNDQVNVEDRLINLVFISDGEPIDNRKFDQLVRDYGLDSIESLYLETKDFSATQ